MSDLLEPILARKRREIARRHVHRGLFDAPLARRGHAPLPALEALKRAGPLPRIIAEVKLASPSEGCIRAWRPGEVLRVARSYEASGAAAVSVLCDRAGFGGSVLDLRRVAREVRLPLLFKEFVLDPIQVDLARAAGASMVLLLVRALSDEALSELVRACLDRALEPVVEAASAGEVERALRTEARVVGVNARDLTTFRVDPAVAAEAIQKIPESRVAVYMSGVSSPEELSRVAKGRADAVLIGTALVRASDPGARLRELVEGAGTS